MGVGSGVGVSVGSGVGIGVGSGVGFGVGSGVGFSVGSGVGICEGFGVGRGVGFDVGSGVGVGSCVGIGVGIGVGSGVVDGNGVGDGVIPHSRSQVRLKGSVMFTQVNPVSFPLSYFPFPLQSQYPAIPLQSGIVKLHLTSFSGSRRPSGVQFEVARHIQVDGAGVGAGLSVVLRNCCCESSSYIKRNKDFIESNVWAVEFVASPAVHVSPCTSTPFWHATDATVELQATRGHVIATKSGENKMYNIGKRGRG